MKKLIPMLAVGICLGATAAPVKVLDVQFADRNGLVSAATKLGEHTGQASLGVATAAMLGQMASEDAKKMLSGTSRMALYMDLEAEGGFEAVVATADTRYEDAPKLDTGDALRVNVNEKGVSMLVKALEEAAKEEPSLKDGAVQAIGMLKSSTGFSMTLGVKDAGLDLCGAIAPVAGSELDKIGVKPLAADPLGFAGKGALYAVAYAADCGTGDVKGEWAKFLAAFAKAGLKTDSFLKQDVKDGTMKLTLDIPAIVKYGQGEGKAAIEKLASDETMQRKLMNDIMAITPKEFKAAGSEASVAVYVDGLATARSSSQRFAKTLPEASGKKCCSVGVFSLYGLVKGVAAKVADLPECKESATIKSMLQGMPSEADADIAGMCWKDAKGLNFHLRLNPAELKGLYTLGSAGAAMFQQQMYGASFEEPEEEDDDED